MPQKNIIVNSLKETFSSIWSNKSLFILLFILQIIFLAALFFLSQAYVTKILESAKAISDYVAAQQLNDVEFAKDIIEQRNIFGEDPLSITRNFNEMVKNFRFLLAYSFVTMVFFAAINWALTNKLLHKTSFGNFKRNFLNNIIVKFSYLILIFAFFYLMFNISFTQAAIVGTAYFLKYIPFLVFSIVLAYFMFISLALIYSNQLGNLLQKTLLIGIKKFHYVFAVYFINLLLFAVSLIFIFYFVELHPLILLFSMLFFIFSFVFGRIFLIKVVEKLED